jgi:excisionase family DNA binding protein
MSGRELAKVLGCTDRHVRRLAAAGMIERERDGSFFLERAVTSLLRHYRERLTLAESLCRRFLPGELESRWDDR